MMNLPKLLSVLFAIASVGVLFYFAIKAAYTKGKLDGTTRVNLLFDERERQLRKEEGWSKVAKGVEAAAENYRKKP